MLGSRLKTWPRPRGCGLGLVGCGLGLVGCGLGLGGCGLGVVTSASLTSLETAYVDRDSINTTEQFPHVLRTSISISRENKFSVQMSELLFFVSVLSCQLFCSSQTTSSSGGNQTNLSKKTHGYNIHLKKADIANDEASSNF